MATRAVWSAEQVTFENQAVIPQLTVVNGRLVLAFDAATDELCVLKGVAPQGLTGALTLVVQGFMASAVANTVGLRAAIEAFTPGDAVDLDAAESYDAENYATSAAVPGTAGFPFSTTITLTNADSMAAGDQYRIRFGRDADGTGSTDSATGDFYVTEIESRDGA
jgi:hypothetical protein